MRTVWPRNGLTGEPRRLKGGSLKRGLIRPPPPPPPPRGRGACATRPGRADTLDCAGVQGAQGFELVFALHDEAQEGNSTVQYNASILPNRPYRIHARCTNAAGLFRIVESATWYLDYTPPTVTWVLFGAEETQSTCLRAGQRLRASWLAADPESGVAACFWAVGRSPGGSDIMGFTEVTHDDGLVRDAEVDWVAVAGQRYFVTLWVTNAAGWSQRHRVPLPVSVPEADCSDAQESQGDCAPFRCLG